MDEQWNRDEKERENTPGRGGKSRFWMGALVGALVTAFAGLIIVGMSAGIYLFGMRVMSRQPGLGTEKVAPSVTDGKAAAAGVDFSQVLNKMNLIEQIIGQYFLYEPDAGQVEDYIYRGMMAGLDDPYSSYYSEEDYKLMRESTSGTYSGIGAMLSQNRNTGLCTIVKVFEGSPAFEAGLKPGDIIYKVEDQLVAGESLDVLVSTYIKGEEGTMVDMTVYRADKDEYVDFTIVRRKIEVPTVEYRMLADKTGYIAVSEFDLITVEQFTTAIDSLTEEGMKGLLIDLRNNPGGVLDGAIKMADYILPDDLSTYEKGKGKTLIVYTADKNGKGDTYVASDGHELDIPIVILVNGDSASASEVFTGALKDYDKAAVVGTTSYGKGIVQNLIPLGDGSAIKITTAHYYTPSGFDLHGKGIEPDVEVELSEELKTQAVVEPEEDNQIQKALEVLKERQK
ncbi:S41 family peptidase [Lacrimispora sp. 210928-DFI.3.58]|nr:S41 family peptidase [Lacrimispora sp. 210928-DFI.3.58]MCB7320430.1 S41 family peptidase [Lacrimispora sp. 210928-DFI.3.58]